MDTIAPYIATSETSRAAAESIRPSAGTLRNQILGALRIAGMTGMTDEQIAQFTGLPGNTARPRRIELQQMGLVVDLGERRKTQSGRYAIVFFAKECLP